MAEPYFNGPLAHLVRAAFAEGQPDPWPAELDRAVRDPTAVPLCINCLFPQEGHCWFCPHCDHATGGGVMLMPYLQIFPMADIARQGVMGPPERRIGVQIFLVVFSIVQYAPFAPVYWFWMIRRARGRPICQEQRKPFEMEQPA